MYLTFHKHGRPVFNCIYVHCIMPCIFLGVIYTVMYNYIVHKNLELVKNISQPHAQL